MAWSVAIRVRWGGVQIEWGEDRISGGGGRGRKRGATEGTDGY